MTEAHAIIAAEFASERACERYWGALETLEHDEHPETIDLLRTEAHVAVAAYEDMLLAEVAENA